MKRGDIVEWAGPLTDDEKLEAFRVLEVRGDRVLVEMVPNYFRIAPTFVYDVADLEVRWAA